MSCWAGQLVHAQAEQHNQQVVLLQKALPRPLGRNEHRPSGPPNSLRLAQTARLLARTLSPTVLGPCPAFIFDIYMSITPALLTLTQPGMTPTVASRQGRGARLLVAAFQSQDKATFKVEEYPRIEAGF